MRYASSSATAEKKATENRTQQCRTEICEETGERLFRAGEYAAPGEYIEIERGQCLTLRSPDFLPARLDGQTACYRLARRGRGETGEQTLAQRQARFHTLAAHTHKRLYNFVRRTLHNPQDAEDMTQEALARAWSYFETYDPQRSFEAWVFRIARNLLIDQSRRRGRRQSILQDAPATDLEGNESAGCLELVARTGDPENCLLAKEFHAELQSALYALPPAYQETLLLVARQHSYEQIARHLDCPVGTVRSRVYRARVLMRRNLKESTPEE